MSRFNPAPTFKICMNSINTDDDYFQILPHVVRLIFI